VVIVVGELEVVELLTRFSGRLMVAELNEPHGAVADNTTSHGEKGCARWVKRE
jgi:hypothetical protein